jgi:hypothetical protein
MTRRRYDHRSGELTEVADADTDEDQVLDHQCDNGWITREDAAGMPVPCLICKPHIAEQRRRMRDRLHGTGG